MNSISKVEIFQIFLLYMTLLIVGDQYIRMQQEQLAEEKAQAEQLAATMATFAEKVKVIQALELEKAQIEQSDITGMKSLIERKRQAKAKAKRKAKLAKMRQAVYPPVPVKFQGELTLEKRILIRSEITAAAKKYLGRPYIYAAKGPNAFDCSGYTSYVMRLFGIEISPGSRYQAKQGKHVDLKEAKVGDLLFFSRYGKGGMVTHVGLILSNTAEGITVIHANGPRHGIMIENVSKSSYWKKKILFARNVIDPIGAENQAAPLAEK